MNCTICGHEVEVASFITPSGEELLSGDWFHADPQVDDNADHHAIPEKDDR